MPRRGERFHNSLSKAGASVARPDLSTRGLRLPRHTFLVEGAQRELKPLFAAPVRPMETLVGIRLQAEAMFQQMAKVAWFTPMEVEIAVWKVPLSQLGDYFIDLLVADAEDDWLVFPTVSGSGVETDAAGFSMGPHSQSAHQSRNRIWAGEIAPGSTNTQNYYTPYVSAATYHVARSFYEMEMSGEDAAGGTTTEGRTSDDLWESPPRLGPHIRTALNSSVPVGSIAGSPDDMDTGAVAAFADSIADWAERLSLMTKPNQTYLEYLADFGVDARRLRTLPEPILIQRRKMARLGSPQGFFGILGANTGVDPFHENHGESVWNAVSNVAATSTYQIYGDTAGMTNFGASYDLTRGKRLLIDEPSILLGTYCFWTWMNHQDELAHYMEITRMTHGAHWGNPIGGVDETDFLSAAGLWSRDGSAGVVPSEQPTGGGNSVAYNLLNLYLNGDSFCNTLENFNTFTVSRGEYGQPTSLDAQDVLEEQRRINVVGQAQFAIASDLVGG